MTKLSAVSGLLVSLTLSSCAFAYPSAAFVTTPKNSATDPSATIPDRFALHIKLVHPVASNPDIGALEVTATNLTDEGLFLSPFAGRECDDRIVIEQGSNHIRQRLQVENTSCPLGQGSRPGWYIPARTSKSELSPLPILYKLSKGTYKAYVLMRDPRTQQLVQSNTLSFDHSDTQAANAK
jgi:hypothetical protein